MIHVRAHKRLLPEGRSTGLRPGFKPVTRIPIAITDSIARAQGLKSPGPGWSLDQEHGITYYDTHWQNDVDREFRQTAALVDPDDFLKWQWDIIRTREGEDPRSTYRSFLAEVEPFVDTHVRLIRKAGSKMPAPFVLLRNGRIDYERGMQEGRHRALAAKRLGQALPVLLVEREYGEPSSVGG